MLLTLKRPRRRPRNVLRSLLQSDSINDRAEGYHEGEEAAGNGVAARCAKPGGQIRKRLK